MEPNNELLREALLEAALEEFRDIPAEEEISLEFSPGFEQRLRLRLAEEGLEEPPLRLRFSRSFRRLAVAVLILALLAATAAVASPTLRENLLRFFPQETATHYEFTFDPEQAATAPKTLETVYLPAHIPEGYETVDYVEADVLISVFWESGSGNLIHYMQQTLWTPEEGRLSANAENAISEIRVINGYKVFCVHTECQSYYWTDNEYFFSLSFDSDLTAEECETVLSSILPVK